VYCRQRADGHPHAAWAAHGFNGDNESTVIAVTKVLTEDSQAAVAQHAKRIGAQFRPFRRGQPAHRRSSLRSQERGNGLLYKAHIPLVVTK